MTLATTGAITLDELLLALDEERLVAVYQPCFDLTTGALVAVEALARLREAGTDRLLPPSAFLPVAEACGLVGRLDAVIAAQAVPQVARWRRLPGGRDLSVAVNTCVSDLDDDELPDRLIALAHHAGLPLDALIVEVTETVLSQTGRGHEQALSRLDAAGCNVTLDDFGTGHNSFGYLQRFPVSGLKVDRSFVQHLGRGGPEGRLVEGLVTFCLSLGVHVVAEGIETVQQLEALRRLGCPFGQGYLLGRPVPAAELQALLEQDHRLTVSAPPAAPPAPPSTTPPAQARRPSRALLPVVASVVALVLLVLTITVVQAHRSTSRSLADAGQGKLEAVNGLAAATIGTRLTALNDLVTAHSRREVALTALRTRGPAQVTGVVEALRTASGPITSASLYDAAGRLLAVQPGAPALVGRSFAYRDWFRGARAADEAYLSEPIQLLRPGSPWALASAAAIRDPGGSIAGYLVASFQLSGLQRLVNSFASTHGIDLTVVDVRGRVLAVPAGAGTDRPGAPSTDPRVLAALGLGAGPGAPGGDERTQWTVDPVVGAGGVVLAEQSRSASLAGYPGQSGRDLLLLGVAVAMTLGLLVLLLQTDRRRRRLLRDLDRQGEELRQTSAWVSALLEATPAAVVVTDADGTVRQANQACAEILRVDADALPGRPLTTWLRAGPDDGGGTSAAELVRPGGGFQVLEVRTTTLRDPQGEVVQVHCLTDVTPHRLERDRLHRQGRTDPLTGLANRRALQDALADRLGPGRDPAHVDALVMLDLDGFKAVNDTLGHGAGDALLVDVARALTAAAGSQGLVARLGGDEFVVLTRVASTADLVDLRRRLRTSVRQATERTTSGTALQVGASVGDAVLGRDGYDAPTLLGVADARMYADKRGVPPPGSPTGSSAVRARRP